MHKSIITLETDLPILCHLKVHEFAVLLASMLLSPVQILPQFNDTELPLNEEALTPVSHC